MADDAAIKAKVGKDVVELRQILLQKFGKYITRDTIACLRNSLNVQVVPDGVWDNTVLAAGKVEVRNNIKFLANHLFVFLWRSHI
jgi:hypothetical protein